MGNKCICYIEASTDTERVIAKPMVASTLYRLYYRLISGHFVWLFYCYSDLDMRSECEYESDEQMQERFHNNRGDNAPILIDIRYNCGSYRCGYCVLRLTFRIPSHFELTKHFFFWLEIVRMRAYIYIGYLFDMNNNQPVSQSTERPTEFYCIHRRIVCMCVFLFVALRSLLLLLPVSCVLYSPVSLCLRCSLLLLCLTNVVCCVAFC